jgi:malonyl-CoA O-methyltransferase
MQVIIPPKNLIARSFSRRASRYCSSAFIQRRLLNRCVEYIRKSGMTGRSWLDAGCGAGMLAGMLPKENSELKLFSTDLAFAALKQVNVRKHDESFPVQSDIEFLPFKNGSFDGIVISSVLHWLEDARKCITELTRVLHPAGTVIFAVFLRGSFYEVCLIRERKILPITVRYVDEDTLKSLIKDCGLDLMDYASRTEVYYFPSAWEILKYLSDIGSTAVPGKRMTRPALLAFCREYEEQFMTERGVPLSCCMGWGMAEKRRGS